jgi:hypothetical protein
MTVAAQVIPAHRIQRDQQHVKAGHVAGTEARLKGSQPAGGVCGAAGRPR